MSIALAKQSHAAFFPAQTLTVADILLLRVILQHVFLWDLEGRPATVSKVARALGIPRTTARRRLTELVSYGYLEQRDTKYVGSAKLVALLQKPGLLSRFVAIIKGAVAEIERSS